MNKTQTAILCSMIVALTACSTPQEKKEIILQQASEVATLRSNSSVIPYTFEESVETVFDAVAPKTVLKDMDSTRTGYSWMISKVKEGISASVTTTFRSTFDTEGNLLVEEPVPGSEVYSESQPEIYQYGANISVGAYMMTSVITKYGYDCVGCGIGLDGAAGTSSGVRVRNLEVRQADGSWEDGITYEGYYIFAADKAYPMCTVVEVSNHTFSGMGLVSGEPFLAIVLDRGSAIKTTHLDLYVGSERNINVVSNSRTSRTKITVVNFLKWTRNSLGQQVCK